METKKPFLSFISVEPTLGRLVGPYRVDTHYRLCPVFFLSSFFFRHVPFWDNIPFGIIFTYKKQWGNYFFCGFRIATFSVKGSEVFLETA